MGNPTDPISMRFPPRIDIIIREFAKKNRLTLRQAASWLIAKGHHAFRAEKDFNVEEYMENFFQSQGEF